MKKFLTFIIVLIIGMIFWEVLQYFWIVLFDREMPSIIFRRMFYGAVCFLGIELGRDKE